MLQCGQLNDHNRHLMVNIYSKRFERFNLKLLSLYLAPTGSLEMVLGSKVWPSISMAFEQGNLQRPAHPLCHSPLTMHHLLRSKMDK